MFIRFDMIHENDRQTDRQTDGRTDGHRMTAIASLMHSIARQKLAFPRIIPRILPCHRPIYISYNSVIMAFNLFPPTRYICLLVRVRYLIFSSPAASVLDVVSSFLLSLKFVTCWLS